MKTVSLQWTIGALLLAALFCVSASILEIRQPRYLLLDKQTDFAVYYTAAALVRDHLGSHLYDEAADGINPQRREAAKGGIFLEEAQRQGIRKVDLYLYPPFLAQLLKPLTVLPYREATLLWRCLGFSMVLLTAGCLSSLLRVRKLSLPSLAVLAGLLSFGPLWQALHYGQITLVLLGLFTAGVLLYRKGWKRTSALLCAVAALIKLTPLLLIVPMIVWRDWRWVRWFCSVLLLALAACVEFGVPGMVGRFFLHVLPSMSGGVISRENQTILSAVQMAWCHGRNVAGLVVPKTVLWVGRLGSMLLLAAGLWLILPRGQSLSPDAQTMVLMSFAQLSLCVAPVAWIDTQVFGYLLLVLLSAQLLRQRTPVTRVLLVAGCAVFMGASIALNDIPWVQGVTLLQYLPLIASIVLTMFALYSIRRDARPGEGADVRETQQSVGWIDLAS